MDTPPSFSRQVQTPVSVPLTAKVVRFSLLIVSEFFRFHKSTVRNVFSLSSIFSPHPLCSLPLLRLLFSPYQDVAQVF